MRVLNRNCIVVVIASKEEHLLLEDDRCVVSHRARLHPLGPVLCNLAPLALLTLVRFSTLKFRQHGQVQFPQRGQTAILNVQTTIDVHFLLKHERAVVAAPVWQIAGHTQLHPILGVLLLGGRLLLLLHSERVLVLDACIHVELGPLLGKRLHIFKINV